MVFVFLVILAVLAGVTANRRLSTPTKEIHLHAGFQVYIDGKLQDYSDSKYMDLEPCTTLGHEVKEDDQKERAHLHDNVGDVVHVHREGAVWGDLFKNIGVAFDRNKLITGYRDGLVVPDVLAAPIGPYESLVIVVGDQTKSQDYFKGAVTVEYIKDVESKSETCGV